MTFQQQNFFRDPIDAEFKSFRMSLDLNLCSSEDQRRNRKCVTKASPEDSRSRVPDVDPGVSRRGQDQGPVGRKLAPDDPRQVTFEDVNEVADTICLPAGESDEKYSNEKCAKEKFPKENRINNVQIKNEKR